ncbi:transporter substrate-binding domain-containing protein [Streptomyces sp. HC307]|uniref:transporter substrate-binding domain-containing protein n=1 Tax=Streptomyces flavusporus TaxID=3385496 RepID=UPI00391755F6
MRPWSSGGADGSAVEFEPDLAAALGRKLGVRFRFEHASFDQLLPGLKAKKFDVVVAGMTDTKKRQLGNSGAFSARNQVAFLDYFTSGSSLVVREGNPRRIDEPGDLCGRTVAVQRATTQVDFMAQQVTNCLTRGEKAPTVVEGDTNGETLDLVGAGTADVQITDTPAALYSVRCVDSDRRYEAEGPSAPAL